MSTDAVAEAIALHRRLAAGRLVRRDEIDAELAATHDEARRAALQAERATVEGELRAALAEINDLMRLARVAQSAPLPAVPGGGDDALVLSPEMAALDNVRAHIRDLEAQVRVNEELARAETQPVPKAEAEPGSDPPPPTGPRKRTM
jgi:hypothetical protein